MSMKKVGPITYTIYDRNSKRQPWKTEAACTTLEEAAAYMDTYYAGQNPALSQLVIEVPLESGTVRLVAVLDQHLS